MLWMVAFWLLTMFIMTILDFIGEAVRGSLPGLISPWTQIKWIKSFATSAKERLGEVSFWILTIIWFTMNLDDIGEALKSFTTCYLSWRSQLNSVAVFGTRFWEWWVNPVAGRTITLTFLLLSSGSWEAIVVEKILFGSKVFVYFLVTSP